MPRQDAYKVTITGWLPIKKSDLKSQKEALDALTGPVSDMVAKLHHVDVQPKMTSREIDDAGQPVPKKPRKPRAAKAATGRRAA